MVSFCILLVSCVLLGHITSLTPKLLSPPSAPTPAPPTYTLHTTLTIQCPPFTTHHIPLATHSVTLLSFSPAPLLQLSHKSHQPHLSLPSPYPFLLSFHPCPSPSSSSYTSLSPIPSCPVPFPLSLFLRSRHPPSPSSSSHSSLSPIPTFPVPFPLRSRHPPTPRPTLTPFSSYPYLPCTFPHSPRLPPPPHLHSDIWRIIWTVPSHPTFMFILHLSNSGYRADL